MIKTFEEIISSPRISFIRLTQLVQFANMHEESIRLEYLADLEIILSWNNDRIRDKSHYYTITRLRYWLMGIESDLKNGRESGLLEIINGIDNLEFKLAKKSGKLNSVDKYVEVLTELVTDQNDKLQRTFRKGICSIY